MGRCDRMSDVSALYSFDRDKEDRLHWRCQDVGSPHLLAENRAAVGISGMVHRGRKTPLHFFEKGEQSNKVLAPKTLLFAVKMAFGALSNR